MGKVRVTYSSNRMLLPVERMLCKHGWRDVSTSPPLCQIQQLLHDFWVRGTIGVVFWSQPVAAGYRGIRLGLEMTIGANTRLVTEQVTKRAERVRLRRVIANAPSTGYWVAVEEHRRCLEEDRSCLVQAEGLPQTGVDRIDRGDTISGEIAMVRSS